jgi:hypothetical protein
VPPSSRRPEEEPVTCRGGRSFGLFNSAMWPQRT